MKIVSWNVNGIVARRRDLINLMNKMKPDIMCVQETKTKYALDTPGYFQYWNLAKRRGYYGTLILAREEPLTVKLGMGVKKYDQEGRFIALEYKEYYVINVYVPSIHINNTPERPDYRRGWDRTLRKYVSKLDKPVILCGDFNVARAWIDSYPENQRNEPDAPIFRSELREGMEQLLSIGLVDAFRSLYPNKEGAYTWFGPKTQDYALNRGSRLDYFLVSGELLSFVQDVRIHHEICALDHTPISMIFNPVAPEKDIDDDDLAEMWRNTDWKKLEQELRDMQKKLAQAAFERKWRKVRYIQYQIENSWAARFLAVKHIADKGSAAGIDGVKWTTDVEKARAARTLKIRGYNALPYLRMTTVEKGKRRELLVSTYRDRAMQTLLSYTLAPVAESTADASSFGLREGRSIYDAITYLRWNLSGEAPPQYVVLVDAETFYANQVHNWLIKNIPMNKYALRQVLKSGVIENGLLLSPDTGISMASPLSPILGNMSLDGLRAEIYNRLYPKGHEEYANGSMVRFMDDIAVAAQDENSAILIQQIILEFLAQRGVRANQKKSRIVKVSDGFDFLGRHFQRIGDVLEVTPSQNSANEFEHKLEDFVENFNGPLRMLVQEVNAMLSRFAKIHNTEDAYLMSRHIDSVVEGLFIKKISEKHPRWHRETILGKYFVRDGNNHVFVLPEDTRVRIILIAPTEIKKYTPCAAWFNPYLDEKYYAMLQYKREVQRTNIKFQRVWNRQKGLCFYCGQRMLADQDVEIIEIINGYGNRVQNLAYIHTDCDCNVYSKVDTPPVELADLLRDFIDDAPLSESPYRELTGFFNKSRQTTIRLSFLHVDTTKMSVYLD